MKCVYLLISLVVFGCAPPERAKSSSKEEQKSVNDQQNQYLISQPIPRFDFSLERDLLIQLYNIRNRKLATHSVWRSDHGIIEGDCPSMGYGLPYDTSLTNPLQMAVRSHGAVTSIGQAEPNGVFASTNTSATWVLCVGEGGLIEPVYVETKVTVYPGPVDIDYDKNIVRRHGKASVNIQMK